MRASFSHVQGARDFAKGKVQSNTRPDCKFSAKPGSQSVFKPEMGRKQSWNVPGKSRAGVLECSMSAFGSCESFWLAHLSS